MERFQDHPVGRLLAKNKYLRLISKLHPLRKPSSLTNLAQPETFSKKSKSADEHCCRVPGKADETQILPNTDIQDLADVLNMRTHASTNHKQHFSLHPNPVHQGQHSRHARKTHSAGAGHNNAAMCFESHLLHNQNDLANRRLWIEECRESIRTQLWHCEGPIHSQCK